jgi:hypothetical protein
MAIIEDTVVGIGGDMQCGTLGPFTLEPDTFVTWGQSVLPGKTHWGTVFGVDQWFRMAISMASPSADTNLPGTSVSIADTASTGRYGDAVIIDENRNAFPALTVINTSELTGGAGQLATVYFNWLSVYKGIYAVDTSS